MIPNTLREENGETVVTQVRVYPAGSNAAFWFNRATSLGCRAFDVRTKSRLQALDETVRSLSRASTYDIKAFCAGFDLMVQDPLLAHSIWWPIRPLSPDFGVEIDFPAAYAILEELNWVEEAQGQLSLPALSLGLMEMSHICGVGVWSVPSAWEMNINGVGLQVIWNDPEAPLTRLHAMLEHFNASRVSVMGQRWRAGIRRPTLSTVDDWVSQRKVHISSIREISAAMVIWYDVVRLEVTP